MNRCVRMMLMVGLATAVPALAAPASAQQWASDMFPTLSHDFGSVARGAKAEYRFTFKNKYVQDVHIQGVRSSCGCTTPRVEKTLIKSNETGEIVAQFNTLGFDGSHTATVTVDIDQPFLAQVQLHIKGYIRKDVVFDPGKVDLGIIDAGKPAETKVSVHYAGRANWQIVDITSANTNFEVGLVPKGRSDGRVDYDLLVRLKGTAPLGPVNDRLTIVTNDLQNTKIPLEVEGNVVASVTVSPTSLQMGTVQPGDKVTGRLVVHGKNPFKVVRVECDNANFKFQTSQEAHALHIIPVTFTAGKTAGKIVERIRVVTDMPGVTLPDVVAHVEVSEPAKPAAAPPAVAPLKPADDAK